MVLHHDIQIMKRETVLLVISLFCVSDIYPTTPSSDGAPRISRIVVENWKELKFNLECNNCSDTINIWSVWFANSKNTNNLGNYKPCNLTKNGVWIVIDPFEKASSDSLLALGISKTNSSNGILLSNLTLINLRDYVKPGMVTKVKFQLLRDTQNINALYFQTPTYSQNMTFNISIHCMNGYKECFTATYKRFDPHAFTKFKNIPRFTTCNISIKGISSDFRGFWSDEVIEIIKTEMSVPMAAPALCIYGGFTLLKIDPEVLDIILHFKSLTRDEARGPLQGYRAHILSLSKMHRVEVALSRNGFRGFNKNGSNIVIEADDDLSQDIYNHDPLIHHGSFDNHDDDASDEFLYSTDHDIVEFHSVNRHARMHSSDYQAHSVDGNLLDYTYNSHHENDKDEREQESYLEITNNKDYERLMKMISAGNSSTEGSLRPPKATEGEKKMPHSGRKASDILKSDDHSALGHRAKNLLEFDRSFDVDSIFVLKGLNSSIRHYVSIDVMTKRGYNDTLELIFVALPSFDDITVLPEVYDVDVIYSNMSLFILWKVKNIGKLDNLVYTIFFCPSKFHLDGRGCARFMDWFHVEFPTLPLSTEAMPHHFKQEVRFPVSVRQEMQRSFVFGVSLSLKNGLSRGIAWRTCEYELQEDPVLPKVSIFNITSESASITVDRPKCSFGAGYIFAFNVSYCMLHHNADNVCSGTSVSFLLHSDVTKFELKDLKERQAYLLSVNVTGVDGLTSHLREARPHTLREPHMGVFQSLQQTRPHTNPFNGAFFSPNVVHFMTADKQQPTTHVVVVHPAMMAFLAIIGIVIIALLLFGLFIFCRLYRKSLKRFNDWSRVRIDLPNQETSLNLKDSSLPVDVNIAVRNDYNDISIKVEQNILPPLLEDNSKHQPIGSDSDFVKLDCVSLLSVASDSFKSFSDVDDSHGFCNDRPKDFVSIFSSHTKSMQHERSKEGGKKQSSSPSFVSLTNCKIANDVPPLSWNNEKEAAQPFQASEISDKISVDNRVPKNEKASVTPGRITKAVKPLHRSPEERKINDHVDKVEVMKHEGVVFSRVLPPIGGKNQDVPVDVVVHCFPVINPEKDSAGRLEKITKDDLHLKKELDPLPSSLSSSSHSLNCSNVQLLPSPLPSSSQPKEQNAATKTDRDYDLPGCAVVPMTDSLSHSNHSVNNGVPFSSSSSLNSTECKAGVMTDLSPPLQVLVSSKSSSSSSSSSSFTSVPSSQSSNSCLMITAIENKSLPILPTMSAVGSPLASSSSSGIIYSTSSSSSVLSSLTDFLTISSAFNPVCSSTKSPKLLGTSTRDEGDGEDDGSAGGVVPLPILGNKKDDDYTGCKEHSVLPMRINDTIFRQPARPVATANPDESPLIPGNSKHFGVDDDNDDGNGGGSINNLTVFG